MGHGENYRTIQTLLMALSVNPFSNTPVELRDTLWWFNYTKEQGGVSYLIENKFRR